MHAFIRKTTKTLAIALVAGAAILTAQAAFAQAPPNPPARFAGSVTVNGQPATVGATVEAHVGSATCGTGAVFMSGADARYVLDSPDIAAAPGCGTDGAIVSFVVGGQAAAQTGVWHSYQLNSVNLSAGGSAPATATATPARTPVAPTTGSGSAAGDGAGGMFFLAAGFLSPLAGAAMFWRSRAVRRV